MEEYTAAPALVLFDIDGTLLRRAGPHHRNALVDAVQAVSGLEVSVDGIPVQGMLDRDIIELMMRQAGASRRQIRAELPAVMAKAQNLYVRRCPDLSGKTCPAVRAVLRKLRRRGVPAGLVTGNLSRIGWRKMQRAGIREHFLFGSFADDGRTRAGLVRLAVRRARQEGWVGKSSTIALVGDHANDIAAAKANRIRSIAVATGLSDAPELEAHEPDYLLQDLGQFRFAMIGL